MGLDHSTEFTAYASATNPLPERITFEAGDAQDLRFPDATFAACLSQLVFNFIPDPAKALHELRRVTAPGGSIAAATWDYAEGMRMLRIFWDAAVALDSGAKHRDENRMPLCRAGELSQLWRQAGLERVEERPLDITMRFESFGDYWEPFLLGQGPAGAHVQTLTDANRGALRAELERRLPPAPFDLPCRAWAVRAVTPS